MTVKKIKDLESWFSGDVTVKGKIKSIFKKSIKNKLMKCVLQDDDGTTIEMLLWDKQVKTFANKLTVNKYYQIKHFTIEPAHEMFNKTKHQWQICVTEDTKINPLPNSYFVQSKQKKITCTYPKKTKKSLNRQLIKKSTQYYGIENKQTEITQFFKPVKLDCTNSTKRKTHSKKQKKNHQPLITNYFT